MQNTMAAVVIERYGPPERLQLARIPMPSVGDDQILIKVRAAGINPIDWRIRSGSLRPILPGRFPMVLGFDVAGDVVALGKQVRNQGWQVGDPVFAYLDNRHGGGYAEYAVASAKVVAAKPANISYDEAAAVPLAASTALIALRDIAKISPGSKILVNGASGGVGIYAIQLGVALEAHVTGVCGPDNMALVASLGAKRVINYRDEDFTRDTTSYDVVFDVVATSSFLACRKLLTSCGWYITTLPSPAGLIFHGLTSVPGRHRHCRFVLALPNGENIRYLARLIQEGRLRPILDKSYPMAEAAAAHRHSESKRARGKLTLHW